MPVKPNCSRWRDAPPSFDTSFGDKFNLNLGLGHHCQRHWARELDVILLLRSLYLCTVVLGAQWMAKFICSDRTVYTLALGSLLVSPTSSRRSLFLGGRSGQLGELCLLFWSFFELNGIEMTTKSSSPRAPKATASFYGEKYEYFTKLVDTNLGSDGSWAPPSSRVLAKLVEDLWRVIQYAAIMSSGDVCHRSDRNADQVVKALEMTHLLCVLYSYSKLEHANTHWKH